MPASPTTSPPPSEAVETVRNCFHIDDQEQQFIADLTRNFDLDWLT